MCFQLLDRGQNTLGPTPERSSRVDWQLICSSLVLMHAVIAQLRQADACPHA